MRRTLISSICVFILALALCIASMLIVHSATHTAEGYRMQSLERADANDTDGAKENLMKLAERWRTLTPYLETLIDHEALHIVNENITDARISLERGFIDDYYKAMALMGEALVHIQMQEGISWSNVL